MRVCLSAVVDRLAAANDFCKILLPISAESQIVTKGGVGRTPSLSSSSPFRFGRVFQKWDVQAGDLWRRLVSDRLKIANHADSGVHNRYDLCFSLKPHQRLLNALEVTEAPKKGLSCYKRESPNLARNIPDV